MVRAVLPAAGVASRAVGRVARLFLRGSGLAITGVIGAHVGGFAVLRRLKKLEGRRARAHQITQLKVDDLKEILGNLPMWMTTPDAGRSVWLNAILQQLWPHLNDAICRILRTGVEAQLRRIVSGKAGITDIVFNEIDLGERAPTLAAIKGSDVENAAMLDIDLVWPSQLVARIGVQFFKGRLTTVPVRLDRVTLRAPFRVTFGPLTGRFPLFEALEISMLRAPQLDLNLELIGSSLASHLGVMPVIERGINRALCNLMLAPKALHIDVMRTKADSTKVRGILYVKVRELRGLPEGLANESIEVEVLLDEHSDRVCATDEVGVDKSGHANFDKPGVRASNTLVVQHEWQRTVTLRVVIPHAAKGMQSADGSVAARHHGARLVYTQLTAPLESIGWLLTHTLWLAGEDFNARVEMAFYPSEHLCRGHLAHELDEPASEEVIARARKAEADAISGTAEAKGPGMGNGGTKSVAAAAGPAATIGSPTVVAERTRGGATAGAVDASAGPAFSPDQVMLSGASMTALQRLREFNPLEDPMVMLVELERAEGVIIGDYSGFSDPYCIISIGKETLRSKTIYSTRNPVWNEQFLIPLNILDVGHSKLSFDLFDLDALGADDSLGSVQIDLTDLRGHGMYRHTEFPIRHCRRGEASCGTLHVNLFVFPIITEEETTRIDFEDVRTDDDEVRRLRLAMEHGSSRLFKILSRKQMRARSRAVLSRMGWLCCMGHKSETLDELEEITRVQGAVPQSPPRARRKLSKSNSMLNRSKTRLTTTQKLQ